MQRSLVLPTTSEGGAELVLNILAGGDLTNLSWDDFFYQGLNLGLLAVHDLNLDCWCNFDFRNAHSSLSFGCHPSEKAV